VTEGITVTYCPECEMGMTKPAHPGYTTIYTTTYKSLCPTGLVDATYTVTESCTDAKPTWTPGPSHIPDGFTVTTKHCSVCEEGSKTATITEPCGCEATGGSSLGPMKTPPAAPVQQISDGQVQATGAAPAPGGAAPGGPNRPAATGSSECNGDDCGGSGSQSPSSGGSSPAPECNGEDCGGSGSQSPANTPVGPGSNGGASPAPYPTPAGTDSTMPTGSDSPLPSGSTSAITPAYSGGATGGLAAPIVLSVVAVVGALAVAL